MVSISSVLDNTLKKLDNTLVIIDRDKKRVVIEFLY